MSCSTSAPGGSSLFTADGLFAADGFPITRRGDLRVRHSQTSPNLDKDSDAGLSELTVHSSNPFANSLNLFKKLKPGGAVRAPLGGAAHTPLMRQSAGTMRIGMDQDAMKDQVRQNLLRPQYDVRAYYKTTGVWQALARSDVFERVTLLFIAMNAMWIWIDTDLNPSEVLVFAPPIFQIAEHSFIVFFLSEWTIRFRAFKYKQNCLRDAWFVFDTFLVIGMLLDGWIMSVFTINLTTERADGPAAGPNASILRIARLLRLSRMARMVRLFRAMPELLILVKGMAAASRSVFFTLCLLFAVLYVFGIAFRQLTEGTRVGDEYFSTVAASMYTLLITGTFFDSLGTVVMAVGEESAFLACLWWLFVLMAAMTIMNMLIGVLCEVVSAVAATEKEAIAVSFVKDRMRELFRDSNKTDLCDISKEEFLTTLQKPEACKLLSETGVDVLGMIDQADSIFSETDEGGESHEKELSIMELLHVILDLRGTNTAKVKHVVDLRRDLQKAISQTHKAIGKMEVRLSSQLERYLGGAGGGGPAGGPAVQSPPGRGRWRHSANATVPLMSTLGSLGDDTSCASLDNVARAQSERTSVRPSPSGRKASDAPSLMGQVTSTDTLLPIGRRASDTGSSRCCSPTLRRAAGTEKAPAPLSPRAAASGGPGGMVWQLQGLMSHVESLLQAARQDLLPEDAMAIASRRGGYHEEQSLLAASSSDPVPAPPAPCWRLGEVEAGARGQPRTAACEHGRERCTAGHISAALFELSGPLENKTIF